MNALASALVSRVGWGLATTLVAVVVLAWVRARRRSRRARDAFGHDAHDPFRRWGQAAFGIVSGANDYADLPPVEARGMLSRWWLVHGPRELEQVLSELLLEADRAPAWSLVRYLVVTRLGVGAGWVSRDEAWALAKPVARQLQSAFDGWPALGHAYVVARRSWQGLAPDGSEDDDGMRAILDNIAELRDGVWPDVPFHRRFRDDEPEA
jgi:hypothetical protein